jgi:hypothetical protein
VEANSFFAQLEDQVGIIKTLTDNISPEQACWKPNAESWSILEVINHLLDEEREDFRAHLDTALHHPDGDWSLINPQGWVTQRGYNQRDLGTSMNAFIEERRKSIEWLRGLDQPVWNIARPASFGELKAGDLLAAWVAHDLLHLRQLVELHWTYTLQEAQPYNVRYAGEW